MTKILLHTLNKAVKKNGIDTKDIVSSFAKGLSVIQAFDNENTHMTVADVASRVDITRASARRLLLTLEHLGYVLQIDGMFSLTPKIIELGYSYFSSLHWTDLAYNNMHSVVDKTKLSCSVSTLDGVNIICLLRIAATRILNEGIHVGTRLPAAYTPTGRLFMAHMDDKTLHAYVQTLDYKNYTEHSITDPEKLYNKIISERELGYQQVAEELEDGLHAVAVPIYNRDHELIATMNVGNHLSYKNTDYMMKTVLPLLQEAANKTTQAIKLLQH